MSLWLVDFPKIDAEDKTIKVEAGRGGSKGRGGKNEAGEQSKGGGGRSKGGGSKR